MAEKPYVPEDVYRPLIDRVLEAVPPQVSNGARAVAFLVSYYAAIYGPNVALSPDEVVAYSELASDETRRFLAELEQSGWTDTIRREFETARRRLETR